MNIQSDILFHRRPPFALVTFCLTTQWFLTYEDGANFSSRLPLGESNACTQPTESRPEPARDGRTQTRAPSMPTSGTTLHGARNAQRVLSVCEEIQTPPTRDADTLSGREFVPA